MSQNYLKSIGAFEVTLNKAINKEATAKGKAAYYLEFITKDGRIVAQRYNKPFTSFDHGKAAKFLSLFKGNVTKEFCEKKGEKAVFAAIQSLAGKPCVVLVTLNNFNGRDFFQVVEVLPESSKSHIEGGSLDAFDDFGSDPISGALDAFEGSKVVEDQDIPF